MAGNLHLFPALLGSPTGQFRVHIIGNSGSGKACLLVTTVGKKLAAILGLPFVSLDELRWKPNWVQTPSDEYREAVRNTLDAYNQGWVVEGNSHSTLGNLVTEKATDVIWLDPPLVLYFPRLLWRTLLRLLRIEPPCSTGCEETIRETFFSRDSIILSCLMRHSVVRVRARKMMERYGLGVGRSQEDWKMRRIGGWGGQLREWLEGVRRMVGKRG
ncbi:hypothetical protein AMATHDRAFT_63111 [Amanita thiersii Skay4041]|uniref:Adenylate kinase n=1 Tax=Amanita thiersii Skay4041 TaxID=703135 RepID=A0A2A9NMM0_9AGAR|nr:hypothetical protein AMATHDRAFT_63111 [Amanita thiersii Skay4041]